jgi:hypothetical protein
MREERGHKFFRAGDLNDDLAVADPQGAASVSRAALHGSHGVHGMRSSTEFNEAIAGFCD